MGWKETTTQENVGKDGGPIETKDVSAVEFIRKQIADAFGARTSKGIDQCLTPVSAPRSC